jgi:hypothetical protein
LRSLTSSSTDEPDPDTGYNFGIERESRKLIAWGGTTPDDEENGLGSLHRLWFYDLSAGPEGWTDNWADGTQSFVFAFDSPSIRDVSGYGFTTTTIHEVGHHVGMSHPHDGYDYEADVDFGPGGPY